MSILKFLFSKQQDNNLTHDDITNIKSLIAHLDAVVNFLYEKNKLNNKFVGQFKSDKMALSRILKINGLAIYFKRHITTTEIKSLLGIIKLSNEIIKIGAQEEHFLSAEEQQRIHLQKLINEITRNHTRWIK